MIPRDLPYNERIRARTRHENKFQFIRTQIVYIPLENGP